MESVSKRFSYLIVIIMTIDIIVGRVGKVMLPIIVKIIIILDIPIGTRSLRWSKIIINSLEILIKCITWCFISKIGYIGNPIIAITTHIIIIFIGILLISKIAITRWTLEIVS